MPQFKPGDKAPAFSLQDPSGTTVSLAQFKGRKLLVYSKYYGIIRSSFLIDEKGKIAGAWYTVSPGDTVPEAMASLK